MQPTRRLLPVSFAAALFAALAPAALADDEYVVESFTGGYLEPPTAVGSFTLQIGPGQDDATKTIDLPFEFPYFGRLVTKVAVCSNGWLAFGTTTETASANAVLPTAAAPNGIVAALWDDLTTGTGAVKTFSTTDAGGKPVFVLAWHRVDTFSQVSQDVLSFEVKLYSATGAIEIVYAPTGTWDGLSYTAGIEDPAGAVAYGAVGTGNDNAGQPVLDWRFTPRAAPITGALLRDRPVAGPTGLGVTIENGLPVAGIDLELVREDTGEVAARGRTAANGFFAIDVLGAGPSTTVALDVLASGVECRVIDGSAAVHRFRLTTGVAADIASPIGTLTLDASADATNPAIRKAVNIQQAAQRGFAWAREAALAAVSGTSPQPESLPRLDIRFVAAAASAIGRSGYVPAATAGTTTTPALAHIHDSTDNPDPWDDDAVLRECGHHVLATISAHPAGLAARGWEIATTTQAAWTEGFSHWFACVVQRRPTFIDTKTSAEATVLDLEAATPAPRKAPDTTGAVAAALWELVDPANETWDEFEGTLPDLPGSTAELVFRTADREMDTVPTGAGYDVTAFFDAWNSFGTPAEHAATARAFIHDGAVADDAREPNDRAGEESAITGVQRVDGLSLSRWNEDHFSFDFAPAEATTLTVSVNLAAYAEILVEVRDSAGVVVASATNTGNLLQTLVTAASEAPVAAGKCTARVAWISGAATTYSLAFFAPLEVATAELAPWTAGVPLKYDLTAVGGVPPYAFSTSLDAPGLSTTLASTRIIGTPGAAGDYPVTVTVTDGGGVGTTTTSVLTLRINPTLVLRPVFGVGAGESVGADVGAGGTDAEWTATGSGDGALVLSGGATLRLAGDSGAARTFDVAGSAVDAVGAAVASGTSHVVVCPQLSRAPTADVAPGGLFGFWFDAVAGSVADLRFQFRGTGRTPVLSHLVDETGAAVDLKAADAVRTSGRSVRLKGARLPRTGRWYVVFSRGTTQPFAGTMSGAAGRVTPPRERHGIVVIDPAEAVVEVTFEAVAGSRLRLLARPELFPQAVIPQIQGLLGPEGETIQIPGLRRVRPSRAVRTDPIGPLTATGTYTLRLAGDGQRTGPIFWRATAVPPRRTRFDLF